MRLFRIIFSFTLSVSAILLVNNANCENRRIEIGVAAMNVDGSLPTVDQILSFEEQLGKKIKTIGWFLGINIDTGELPKFPLEELNEYKKLSINSQGSVIPMLTLEPWGETKDLQGNPKSPFDGINNGSLDSYFKEFAKNMKSYGDTIRLRFGHEMIHNDVPEFSDPTPGWYPWQDYPKQYVEAFRRIHHIFQEVGAINVEFVWAPNFHIHDYEILAKYYPGPTYVHWIGLDGYNWDGQDFEGIFRYIYMDIIRHSEIFGKKPIMISEFAMAQSLDKKRSKTDWIRDAFKKMKNKYPQIQAFYWFNINKEHDWRLSSSDETWEVFKKIMQDNVFISR